MANKSVFATTSWSVVLTAGERDSSRARQALAALCEAYWFPVYAFIRSRGPLADEARDLTQGYFLQLLDKGFLEGLRPEAGRFRAFLLVSVRHFLSNERDRDRALKRGGGHTPISLDAEAAERRFRLDPPDRSPTPERLFERRWALTVLENAMAQLREESLGSDEGRRFDRLKGYLTDDGPASPYADVAAELGISEAAVKVAVHRLRQRFGQALRAVVARTVSNPGDIDDEIRSLLLALGD